jgi:hypothetical protein
MLSEKSGGRAITQSRELDRQWDRLGARKLSLDELHEIRRRFHRSRFITNQFELGRLRVKLSTLDDYGLRCECEKAIASIALQQETLAEETEKLTAETRRRGENNAINH